MADLHKLDEAIKQSAETCLSLQKKYLRGSKLEENEKIIKDTVQNICITEHRYINMYDKIDSEMKKCHHKDVNEWCKELERIVNGTATDETETSYTSHKLWQQLHKDYSNVFNESFVGDVLLTQSTVPNVDPITKQEIRNPYKNNECGHVYEKESILSYIVSKKNAQEVICPYVACNKTLNVNDIIENC